MPKNYFLKSSYFYNLPENLIAQTPLEPRDSSKLLVYNPNTDKMEHRHFYDITDYLKPGDVLVINNTKVIPARLIGVKEKTNAKAEVFLLKRINLTHWEALVKPGKKLKEGSIISFGEGILTAKILQNTDYGGRIVEFSYKGVFEDILDKLGETPLPPYIHTAENFKERYNTVYAKIDGSSASPTAGLHFTENLIEKIKAKGVYIAEVLLHVGLGTFRPVKEDNILKHKMHSEYYEISLKSANLINNAKKNGGRIIAVGTTSLRTLESAEDSGLVKAGKGNTDIFIYPGSDKKIKITDCLITNFHLPESTLIMLVSAFIGYDETMKVYSEAVKNNYRFFSFGDSSFFIKKENNNV